MRILLEAPTFDQSNRLAQHTVIMILDICQFSVQINMWVNQSIVHLLHGQYVLVDSPSVAKLAVRANEELLLLQGPENCSSVLIAKK